MSPFDGISVVAAGSVSHESDDISNSSPSTLTRRGRARTSSSATSTITETLFNSQVDHSKNPEMFTSSHNYFNKNTQGQSVVSWLLEHDTSLSCRLYDATQNSPLLKALAKLISLSCDEVLWFLIPCVVPSVIWASRGGPFTHVANTITCEEEMLLDVFGAVTLCVFVEQVSKSFFQRSRPKCLVTSPNKLWCVFGEWWSFPSGHTLRAFYLYVYFAQSSLLRAAMGESMHGVLIGAQGLTLLWAIGVGWARVAMGKHHILDVVAGAAIGSWLAGYIETSTSIDPLHRVGMKTVAGVVVAIQTWFFLFDPLVRMVCGVKNTRRMEVMAAITKIAYFSFYLCALWSVALVPMLQGFHIKPLSMTQTGNDLVCARSLELFGGV